MSLCCNSAAWRPTAHHVPKITASRFSMLNATATSEFSPCACHFLFTTEHALMIVKSGSKPTSSAHGGRHVHARM
jgi:hypothetical protein